MRILKTATMAAAIFSLATLLPAQTFSSGSTGADGAYSPTVSGDFDPAALGINAAGDNVFNFTTINIPAGVTIRLRATKVRNAPVVWLATGNVTIVGTLNLTGDNGYALDASSAQQVIANRRPAEPGAGGYYGGMGSRGGIGPETGSGPGGGPAGLNSATGTQCYGGSGAGFSAGVSGYPYPVNGTGTPYGSLYMVPMYGGSGGGGGWGSNAVNATGGGGGAGGGALRIVSTSQISVTGIIDARGGNSGGVSNSSGTCNGGNGAGGAVNLIAPTIAGNGTIYVYSGSPTPYGGNANGIIRFNVTNFSNQMTLQGGSYTNGVSSGTFFIGPLYNVPANASLALPLLKITQINGANVPYPPTGSYLNPDIQINANTAVTVSIAANNVPVGTVPTLRVTAETAADQSITCTALAGTAASSTSTCSATFPFSISVAGLRATF